MWYQLRFTPLFWLFTSANSANVYNSALYLAQFFMSLLADFKRAEPEIKHDIMMLLTNESSEYTHPFTATGKKEKGLLWNSGAYMICCISVNISGV